MNKKIYISILFFLLLITCFITFKDNFYKLKICNNTDKIINYFSINSKDISLKIDNLSPWKCSDYKNFIKWWYFKYELNVKNFEKEITLNKNPVDNFDYRDLHFWKNILNISNLVIYTEKKFNKYWTFQIRYE